MRIKIQQFLFFKSHSWAVVGQNLGRAFIKQGHDVEFISTDGIDYRFLPKDLIPFVRDRPNGIYDMQLSYTAPHNWPNYTSNGIKRRYAIWNYEYNSKQFDNKSFSLLHGFGKYYKSVDYVLPSSNFTKDVFLNMKIPENKMIVIPHGINLEDYTKDEVWSLKTKKNKKILLNVAQPHLRKALHLALEAFGKAFTKKDDVCLVAKIFKQNKTNHPFDVDFNQIYKEFEHKFPNHAEVEFVFDYITNIASIYKACDINFSATHTECWHLPSLEALACGLINIVPRYGGILDFCNNTNSLLIDGSVKRAPKNHQYWESNPFAVHFVINTDDAAKKLKLAVEQYDHLKSLFSQNMKTTSEKFTWNLAAKQILSIDS
jgi:glycosyltransferase involved in cell wall biosynthesis